MRVIDANEPADKRRLKALVYGKSGTGKTNFGVSAPNPLILLSEQQAVPHIRAAAKRLGKPMPPVIVMEELSDYRRVLLALKADRTKPFVVRDDDGDPAFEMPEFPETVVLDSVTDACELISQEIREQSPPKVGKDGLPVDSERYWNVLMDRAVKLIRAFRDVDANVLFLCLLDERVTGEGDDQVRWVGPQMPMRKLPGALQAAVNVVGVTYRKLGKDKTSVFGISTFGPDYMELKPFPPLRPAEVTDFTSWCERINGIDDGSVAPEPMTDVTNATQPAEAKVETKPEVAPETKVEAKPEAKPDDKKQSKNSKPKTEQASAPAQTAEVQ